MAHSADLSGQAESAGPIAGPSFTTGRFADSGTSDTGLISGLLDGKRVIWKTLSCLVLTFDQPVLFCWVRFDGMYTGLVFSDDRLIGFRSQGVGAALAVLRQSAVRGSTLLQRRLLVTCEITSKDPSYAWFLHWMSATSRSSTGARGFGSGRASHQLAVETKHLQRSDGSAETSVSLVPGPGTHYFKYRKAWFQVKRERQTMMDLNIGTPFETITMTTLSRDRHLLGKLLTEAKELAKASTVGKTIIYTAWGPEWRPFGQPRDRRLLDSVVLDDGIKETIVEDVKAFMGRGSWYRDRGIPYRRGYLLYGPPGSGKSSFVQALAGSLEYNICVLNLSERGLTDDKLNHLLANAPERALLLLEDIDAAFVGRSASADGYATHVTFSGLLNALDGVASSTSQRLLFMTTNHVDRLDPALIRPGRVDIRCEVGDATARQALRLFERFYTEADDPQLAAFVSAMDAPGRPSLSMAALQGHFIRHASNADAAISSLADLAHEAAVRQRGKGHVTPSMPNFG